MIIPIQEKKEIIILKKIFNLNRYSQLLNQTLNLYGE